LSIEIYSGSGIGSWKIILGISPNKGGGGFSFFPAKLGSSLLFVFLESFLSGGGGAGFFGAFCLFYYYICSSSFFFKSSSSFLFINQSNSD
jgi:hypothetical protein